MSEQSYVKELFGLTCSPEDARELIRLRTWFTSVADFDPVSGNALPQDTVSLLAKAGKAPPEEWQDRLYRLCDYGGDAFRSIFDNLRRQILREHEVLPIHAARELDTASLLWISRQPGRTVREKLGVKQKVMAVKRQWSIDTLENRLLKATAKRLAEYLAKRIAITRQKDSRLRDEKITALYTLLRRWLQGGDAAAIGPWANLPPNNTLLHHKQYRKIWNIWGLLRHLDDDVAQDRMRLRNTVNTAVLWQLLAAAAERDASRIVQMPIELLYDTLEIKPAVPMRGFDPQKGPWTASIEAGKLVIRYQNGDKFCRPVNLPDLPRLEKEVFNLPVFRAGLSPKKIPLVPHSTPADRESDLPLCTVVDICAIRPDYVIGKGGSRLLPLRLLRQEWEGFGSLDCGSARAIMLSNPEVNIQSRSMFSLFTSQKKDEHALTTASSFVESIKADLHPAPRDTFCYLVPDWISDFSLEDLTKGIRYSYKDAIPLPRSIAAIGALQSSRNRITSPTLVLVLDLLPGAYSITPVEAKYSAEVKSALGETEGIQWERHPTFTVPSDIDWKILKKLQNMGFPGHKEQEILSLFGLDGLARDAKELSVVVTEGENADSWFHIDPGIQETVATLFRDLPTRPDHPKIAALLKNMKFETANVMVLNRFRQSCSLVEGGRQILEWQERLGPQIPFWRDHLPKLFMRVPGLAEPFPLIDSKESVAPLYGVKTTIHNDRTFILPKEAQFCHFPLVQGEGKSALQFEAFVQSPAFPLPQDTECKLKMTYTYGEDMPYELHFVPVNPDKANFKSILVLWKNQDDIPVELLSPPFPERKTWAEFKIYPKKDSSGTSDLLDWCMSRLDNLKDPLAIDREKIIASLEKKRKIGYFKEGWGKNDKYYCKAIVDGIEVFCSSASFLEPRPSLLHEGRPMFMEVFQGSEGPYGTNISFSEHIPQVLIERQLEYFQSKIPEWLEGFERNLYNIRFPVITIWNQHSLSEPDVPSEFRSTVLKSLKIIYDVFQRDDLPESLHQEILYFLCCLHKDAPGELIMKELLPVFDDATWFRNYAKNIAFAIGDAGLEWQADLFNRTLSKHAPPIFAPSLLEILAMALWRNEKLVYKIPQVILFAISEIVYDYIERDCIGLSTSTKPRLLHNTALHLELLLALLRTRDTSNDAVKSIFMPRGERATKMVKHLDRLCEILEKGQLSLISRLTLDIQKPPAYQNMPDLIYALRLYLTGDSGAHQIRIKGVTEEQS